MIDHLSPKEAVPPEKFAGQDHPLRVVTREVAFDPEAWTAERRGDIEARFDQLAPEWHTRHAGSGLLPLRDALERGETQPGLCVEIGCGTGTATECLTEKFETTLALDLSWEMLRRAPPVATARIRADANRLPLANASADTIVLMNMLLFPEEMDRVLAPRGTILWINSRGSETPIHLSAEDLVDALPGAWNARTALAGSGLWCVVARAT